MIFTTIRSSRVYVRGGGEFCKWGQHFLHTGLKFFSTGSANFLQYVFVHNIKILFETYRRHYD